MRAHHPISTEIDPPPDSPEPAFAVLLTMTWLASGE